MDFQAYKDSEVGRIPSDWSVKQIGKIGYTYSGLTGKGKNDFGKGNAQYITFLNVLNNPVLRTDIFEKVSVSEGEHQNLALKGDLFFNTSSETPEEVGICALLDDDVTNLYLNSFCFGYRLTDSEVDGLYLSYFFRSKAGRDIMTMLAQGATRYNLSKESFNKTLIAFPPYAEQKKIAEALSGVDGLIGALDEAIEKKRQIKEGLMQQLLTGKTRLPGFSGGWKESTLGDLADICKGVQFDSDLFSDNGRYPMLNGGITPSGYSEYYNTAADTITISEGGNSCGYVNYMTENFWCGGHCYSLKVKSVEKIFLYQLLKFNEKDIMALRVGSGLPNVQSKSLIEFHLYYPEDRQEQESISIILKKADDEIASLESQRDKYTLIKQGMMQELLTGKTRLI